jgi:SAM-dependent methyltransferase
MINKCPICKSSNISSYIKGKDRLHAIKGSYDIWKCDDCGLLFINPQPAPKILDKHYPKEYHAYAEFSKGGWKERFSTYLYKLYFSTESKGFTNFLLKILFLPLKHLLRGTYIKTGSKILDVGCGSGAFLYKMKKCGMDTYGVEPSKDGCKAAQKIGLDVKCGFIENHKFPSNHFDVITLNHVFEHVYDPVATINELKRILKKNGRIIMAFPNSDSIQFRIFRKYWAALDVPRHLNIYSPKTIRYLARLQKLKLEKIRYISFPFGIQASLSYMINRKDVPLNKTWMGTSRLLYLIIFPIVYMLDFLHIGDVIEVTLRKS